MVRVEPIFNCLSGLRVLRRVIWGLRHGASGMEVMLRFV